ncbi:MAG TPA: hypothetical protein VLD62_05415 [Acidimicrobiia bacterium]|nr:hypothetical protein [Acidimicrobiia bacterium]
MKRSCLVRSLRQALESGSAVRLRTHRLAGRRPDFGGYCEELYTAGLAIGADGLPIVAYGDDRGVHLIRCPDLACTPP